MKNKNIISLTVAIVAVVLIGMLGLSHIFETNWQQENTVDNNLNVKITDNSETVFNYPYLTPQQAMDNGRQVDLKGLILAAEDNIDLPDTGFIDYQTAVNKVGEDIKYLTGFKNHTVQPVVAQHIYNSETTNGYYIIKSVYKPAEVGNDYVLEFKANLDAKTNQYNYIRMDYEFLHSKESATETFYSAEDISEDVKNKISVYVKEMLSVLGYKCKGDIFNYHIASINYDKTNSPDVTVYTVYSAVLCEDDSSVIIRMGLYEMSNNNVYYPMDIIFSYN